MITMHNTQYAETLGCFLWQQSYFYTKAKFAKNAWHLRWFTLTVDRMMSVPNRTQFEKHKMHYPVFRKVVIDRERLIIKVVNPREGKRDFYLMAPSESVFDAVVNCIAYQGINIINA